MLLTILAMAIQLAGPQDGPIRTAPVADAASQAGAATPADPDPRCTFGGRPVHSPGCPTPEGRVAFVTPTEPPPADDDEANPWDAVNRSPSAQANIGEGGYSRSAAAEATAENGAPAWALADPARWETSQCGAAGDEACRRRARNRLAMARAGIAAEPPGPTGGGTAPQDCRMVMQRSESGFGGSLSRVCGDGAEAEAALDRLQQSLRPAVEPCDRPAALETQDAWIARCRALPAR